MKIQLSLWILFKPFQSNPTNVRGWDSPPMTMKTVANAFARFLVSESAKAELSIPTHPIAVSKSIAIYVSKPKEVKQMRSGALLVEVQNKKELENLQDGENSRYSGQSFPSQDLETEQGYHQIF